MELPKREMEERNRKENSLKEELHWYFVVQYTDKEGFESRREFIRVIRSRYRTEKGCWKAALDEILNRKEDYENITNITIAAKGWEEKGKWQLI